MIDKRYSGSNQGKWKGRLLILLVLSTFLIALGLYIFTIPFDKKGDQNGGGEIIGVVPPIGIPPDRYEPTIPPIGIPPDRYEPTTPPIGSVMPVKLYWPTISSYELSKSIINYEGGVDKDLFINKFETEFKNSYTGVGKETYTFDYTFYDDSVEVYVDSHLKFVGINKITNPTHTYTYVLKENI